MSVAKCAFAPAYDSPQKQRDKLSLAGAAIATTRLGFLLAPGAGDVIAHGHEEHDGEPEHGSDDDKLGALGAVLAVHEEEDDERGFEDGDSERDDDVQAGEVCVEIDLGGGDGENGADHQNAEYGEVDLGRNYVVFRHALAFLPKPSVAIDQIEQREQENPNDINEVPVETDIFDGSVVLRREAAAQRFLDEP
jgi:hypothetical protein